MLLRYLLASWTKRKLQRYEYRLVRHHERAVKLKIKSDPVNVLELAARWMYFDNKCCFCGDGRRTVQIDHLVAVSKQGDHSLLNLFPCCKRCNRTKSNREWKVWFAEQTYYSLEKEKKVLVALKTEDPGDYLQHLQKRATKQ